MTRPPTLSSVAALTAQGGSFDFALRSFLDEFAAHPEPWRIAEEPECLAARVEFGDRYDAYLAASAETLAREKQWTVPDWVWQENRILSKPWFALPWPGLRNILLVESPVAFRFRNLFVSANALSRV